MRAGWLAVVAGCVLPWIPLPTPPKPVTLVIGGDLKGYLSPCGCTKPMTGGILRRGDAIRQLRKEGEIILLENTGWVADGSIQSRMKFQAIAEMHAQLKVDAVHFGKDEAKLGSEEALIASNLLGERLIGEARDTDLVRSKTVGSVEVFADQIPEESAQFPVILLDGNREKAIDTAGKLENGLVVFRSTGDALPPERIGSSWIVTPGENGKSLLVLKLEKGQITSPKIVRLTPEYENDPAVQRLYRRYLGRVDSEKLLDQVARSDSDPFAGTAACMSCHTAEGEVWKDSAHAHALTTLEEEGHDRDPECVGCHVVGLEKKGGFTSAQATPALSHVGCESCHGAGGNHSRDPYQFKLPKVGEKSCAPCHKPEHSPGFDFPTYWKQIAHGSGRKMVKP